MLGLGNTVTSGYVTGSKYSQYAARFDGTADFVKLAETARMKPTTAISISLWVKSLDTNGWNLQSGSDEQVIIGCLRTGGWRLLLSNTGGNVTTIEWTVRVNDTGSGSEGYITATLNESKTEALDGWVHFAMKWDQGGESTLWWNGLQSGVTNGSSAEEATIVYHSAATPVAIGADMNNDTNGEMFFNGIIDEVAIFNTSLDQNDVDGIFNGGKPFDISSNSGTYDKADKLIWYGNFEEGTGTVVNNRATGEEADSGNEGGLGNAWTWSTDTPSTQSTWSS